jgi:hypothetical protein
VRWVSSLASSCSAVVFGLAGPIQPQPEPPGGNWHGRQRPGHRCEHRDNCDERCGRRRGDRRNGRRAAARLVRGRGHRWPADNCRARATRGDAQDGGPLPECSFVDTLIATVRPTTLITGPRAVAAPLRGSRPCAAFSLFLSFLFLPISCRPFFFVALVHFLAAYLTGRNWPRLMRRWRETKHPRTAASRPPTSPSSISCSAPRSPERLPHGVSVRVRPKSIWSDH